MSLQGQDMQDRSVLSDSMSSSLSSMHVSSLLIVLLKG